MCPSQNINSILGTEMPTKMVEPRQDMLIAFTQYQYLQIKMPECFYGPHPSSSLNCRGGVVARLSRLVLHPGIEPGSDA